MAQVFTFLAGLSQFQTREVTVSLAFFFVYLLCLLLRMIFLERLEILRSKQEQLAVSGANNHHLVPESRVVSFFYILLKKFDGFFLLVLCFYFLSKFLSFPDNVTQILNPLILIILSVYVLQAFERFVLKALDVYERRQKTRSGVDQTVLQYVKVFIRIILWILLGVFILQNLHFQVTGLLGGLGIASLAISFAFKSILEDFFFFLMIYFDKPLSVGDYIVLGKDAGIVRKIGIRSTRLETPEGQELIVSNKELTTTRIQNFKRIRKRRGVITLPISAKTSPEKLTQIKPLVQNIFRDLELTSLDRVHLQAVSKTRVEFEIVYFVLDTSFRKFMDIQEQIYFALLKALAKEKISLAE